MKKIYSKPEMTSMKIAMENSIMAGSGNATSSDGTTVGIHDTNATTDAESNSGSFWDDED